jgi:hypothetical protein
MTPALSSNMRKTPSRRRHALRWRTTIAGWTFFLRSGFPFLTVAMTMSEHPQSPPRINGERMSSRGRVWRVEEGETGWWMSGCLEDSNVTCQRPLACLYSSSGFSRDVPPAEAAGRRLRRAPERVTEMTCILYGSRARRDWTYVEVLGTRVVSAVHDGADREGQSHTELVAGRATTTATTHF